MDMLDKVKSFLDSEEGKKSIEDSVNRTTRETKIKNIQLKRLKLSGNFVSFIEKVIVKYSTDKYHYRWLDRGKMPPESLFWFLFSYAKKYGRICNKKEWKQYGNMFTANLFFCGGYYFNQMNGQGSVLLISKKD